MSETTIEAPPATASLSPSAVAEPTLLDAPHREQAPVDRLAVGMAFLLAMTVVQRGVGLVRNVLFCRMLTPEELGRWNLAYSFLMLAAPLAVLGLPGSFGRYAEHYRNRGHLRIFLRRTLLATTVLALAASATVVLLPGLFSQLIFRDARYVGLTQLVGASLAAVIAFNALTELFTALRRVRVASMMHFTSSVAFALVGLTLLGASNWGVGAVAAAFAASCIVACLAAAFCLGETWRTAPVDPMPLSAVPFWKKLAPFAAWMWATNLLANLASVADRYLILYFAQADASAASALVGQYHSSRVAPELLASIAALMAAAILPYNSHNWELGDRRAVWVRMNLTLKLTGLLFTAAGVLILLASPLMFGWALDGKYALGEQVQPWVLVMCVWSSLAVLAQSYLWCAERAGLATLAIGIGLAANTIFNLILLPRLELTGAAAAAAAAQGVMLAVTLWLCRKEGMAVDRGTLVASALPLTLLAGVALASAIVAALAILALCSQRLLTTEEKKQIMFWNAERGMRK